MTQNSEAGVVRRPGLSYGICVNYAGRCSSFEKPVPAVEGDTCPECGQHLMHESGLTWQDAKQTEGT